MKELIIVGAGPAGITAGIYAARKKMDFLIITENVGGQAFLTVNIENYVGYQFITGPELIEKFKKHLEEFNVELRKNERVKKVSKEGEVVKVFSEKGEYKSKTLIIATGRKPKKLNVKGELEYRSRGVSYCATCDGPLFSGKDIAVIGGGNSGFDVVLQMVKICKRVYLIEKKEELSADKIMIEKSIESGKVEIYKGYSVIEIYGDEFVRGIKIKKNNKIEDLKVEGVFIEIGTVPNSEIIENIEKNEAEEIIVACGEGAKAAIASFNYINRY